MNATILSFYHRDPIAKLRLSIGDLRTAYQRYLVNHRLRSELLTERIQTLRLNPESRFPLKAKEAILNSSLSR